MSVNRKRNRFPVIILALFIVTGGCKKFLDEKSNQSLIIPAAVQDLQALVDNQLQVNQRDPSAADLSADDYYLSTADYQALSEEERNMYTWQKSNLFKTGINNDWALCYISINRANQVLEGLKKIERLPGDEAAWNNAKGHALFLRARSFLFAVALWAVAYDPTTANTDPGIPLRLSPEFNTASVRASVQASYDQVIADLKEAVPLLPETAVHVVRPGKAAAYAMLARTYLWMRRYDSCLKYTDSCLQIRSGLKNYNELNAAANYPFSALRYNNPEDLSNFSMAGPPNALNNSRAKVDSMLFNAYNVNDLRKKVFFRANTGANTGSYAFKGSYVGSVVPYSGIALDEVWLMRAECYARAGEMQNALNDLNRLLTNRWNNAVPFVPVTAANAAEALSRILEERRKELLFRGLRWMDIKRLNKEGANIVLQRLVNNQIYTLLPNDKRYALPIPEDVIAMSGMLQNER